MTKAFLSFALSARVPRPSLRALFVFATLVTAAGTTAATVPGVDLGEAPYRIENQDITGWTHDVPRKSARTRDQVAQLYNNGYLPGNSVALNWTGTISPCNPGTTNSDHQQAVIDRVNYYRALVDLPPVALLTGLPVTQVQAAALIMSANNMLSHTPPPSWTCYSADGAAGAGSANIALGIFGVGAMDGFMDDYGAGNTATGHRRWILFPPRAGMATGDTTGNAVNRPANALYVFGPTSARPATPSGVAWPPAGFVPYQNLPSVSNRWSFSFPGADFSGATVTMSGPAGPIPVTQETIANGFGDNTLVFLPTGFLYAKPAADTVYTVTVSGMTGAGVPASVQYTVTVIDPATSSAPTFTVVEYYNASLDHYFITWIPGEIAILDAGVTIKGWVRTGKTFQTYTTAQPGTSPVCRYYIPPGLGDSHFFGRGTVECNATGQKNPSFVLEEPNFMFMFLPVAGVCPANTVQVYRVFSNRPDANHRYMTDKAVRDQMVALNWLAEGDGPDLVVMCAPQ